jgi:exodeoxyribonuclease VII small subunit
MAKKEEMTFEESLKKLEEIVKDLENGNVQLDDAINKFKEAMDLSKTCNEKLKSAEENVNKILKENGKLEDFKIEE